MSAAPSTVDVKCPRCDVPITCTLKLTAVPSTIGGNPPRIGECTASVPDLAERFAAHYRDAGHARVSTDFIENVRQLGKRGGEAFHQALADRQIEYGGQIAGAAVDALLEVAAGDLPMPVWPEALKNSEQYDSLVVAGFEPSSVRAALDAGDPSLLRHTAMSSDRLAAEERLRRAADKTADAAGRVRVEQAKLNEARGAGDEQ